ncbi:MAG: dihydroorotase [Myxococcales bacterium]|nr:dihydroorotase [Myxococcales bacterium]
MSDRLLIRGGRLLSPATGLDGPGTLEIEGGQIVAVHPGEVSPGPGVEVINAHDRVVCPGFIELHAHLGEPGDEHKEDLASAGRAAAQGGFTTVCARPDTHPVNDSRAVTEYLVRRAAAVAGVRVLPIAALTLGREGKRLTEMFDLREGGAVAFGEGDRAIADAGLMRRALEYARALDAPVFEYPEDAKLAGRGVIHEGPVATRLGLEGAPAAAEDVIALRALALAEQTGARIHLGPISTRGSVRALRLARAEGLPITASVSALHLHFTDEDVAADWSTDLRLRPPLRPRGHVEALRAAVAEGLVEAISGHHWPQGLAEKQTPFGRAEPGAIGFETTLGLTLRLVESGVFDLQTAVARLTSGPARVLGLPAGRLTPGAPADVVVFDPRARTRIDGQTLASKARNTPLLGQALPGRVASTVVGGRVVYDAERSLLR